VGRERYGNPNRASGDGIWIDGKFRKMDITRLVFDQEDYYKEQ